MANTGTTAATVASAATTVVSAIIERHTVNGVPGDVMSLINGGITAAVTYGISWFLTRVPKAVAADVKAIAAEVPDTVVSQLAQAVSVPVPAPAPTNQA